MNEPTITVDDDGGLLFDGTYVGFVEVNDEGLAKLRAALDASQAPPEPLADAPCAGCEAPSVVTVRVEWAETTDVARYCMDCAADLVGQGYGTVDEPAPQPPADDWRQCGPCGWAGPASEWNDEPHARRHDAPQPPADDLPERLSRLYTIVETLAEAYDEWNETEEGGPATRQMARLVDSTIRAARAALREVHDAG